MLNGLPYALAAGLTLMIAVVVLILRSRKPARSTYTRQDFLLSPEERSLFKALDKAIGDEYVIFAKIRILDVISPRTTTGVDPAWNALDALGERHFAFILCRQSDLSIACAVMMVQHQIPGRKKMPVGEHPLKSICTAAGLPLLRLESSPFYDSHDIRQAVAEAVRREPLFISEADGRREPTIAEFEKLDS